jgi:hypothetical protein
VGINITVPPIIGLLILMPLVTFLTSLFIGTGPTYILVVMAAVLATRWLHYNKSEVINTNVVLFKALLL